MTPERRRECLNQLRWSQRSLTAIFPYDDRTIRRWFTDTDAPADVDQWLETLAAFHAAHPPPVIVRG